MDNNCTEVTESSRFWIWENVYVASLKPTVWYFYLRVNLNEVIFFFKESHSQLFIAAMLLLSSQVCPITKYFKWDDEVDGVLGWGDFQGQGKWFSGPEVVGRQLRDSTLLPGFMGKDQPWCENLKLKEKGLWAQNVEGHMTYGRLWLEGSVISKIQTQGD